MRGAAEHYGEPGADAELWGITGLLHDFDYEQFPTPDLHPFKGTEILRAEGYPEEIIEAILGHAAYTGVARRTQLARSLFAVDELSGFIVACALVRPDRSLQDLTAASVRKKLKDKAFARTVNRDDVIESARELGVDLNGHIAFVINALRAVERDIGLGRSDEN
jgi:predicted hydrolase (HD superfamily)